MCSWHTPTPENTDSAPKELPKSGLHPARLIWIIDLGTRIVSDYKNPSIQKPKHQFLFGWELTNSPMNDGRPFMISEYYTVSNGKYLDVAGRPKPYISKTSKLFEIISGWRGDWDEKKIMRITCLQELIGAECMVNVVVKPKATKPEEKKAVVGSVAPMMAGLKLNEQVNPTMAYGFGDELDCAPEHLHDRIKQSFEFKGEPVPAYKDEPAEGQQTPADVDIPRPIQVDVDCGIPF